MKKQQQIITQAKSGTIIAKCSCNHAFQNERYGYSNRVMNLTANGKGRCTVCSKVQADK